MNRVAELHREAMDCADRAYLARRHNEREKAQELLVCATRLEQAAAALLADAGEEAEPTRSVLHRSAATLALQSGDPDLAERLVCRALAGDAPPEVAEELRDLLEQVNFHRHLKMRGVELLDGEFQMSIAGKSVGFGIANSEVFLERVTNTERLLYRVAERQLKRPYRDRGRTNRWLEQTLSLYLTVPRAASFAVSFRVGGGSQLSLPGADAAQQVVDEFMDCLDLFNQGDLSGLEERIGEEAYLRNFVGLARNIAPDGEAVNFVGFTAVRTGQTKTTSLTRPRDSCPILVSKAEQSALGTESVALKGSLRFADARKQGRNRISVIDPEGHSHAVFVPEGMMDDIVRPMWGQDVVVEATRREGLMHLVDIRSAR